MLKVDPFYVPTTVSLAAPFRHATQAELDALEPLWSRRGAGIDSTSAARTVVVRRCRRGIAQSEE